MLTGKQIIKEVKKGRINISDFDLSRVNPNSYNVRLGKQLRYYTLDDNIERCLDPITPNTTEVMNIPNSGLILLPGKLYLGSTIEKTNSKIYVPQLDGRSSTARLGMQIHLTAGFGDLGWEGEWTLEITCVHPVRVYAGMEIGQVYFEKAQGNKAIQYHGKYQHSSGPEASRMYMDMSLRKGLNPVKSENSPEKHDITK